MRVHHILSQFVDSCDCVQVSLQEVPLDRELFEQRAANQLNVLQLKFDDELVLDAFQVLLADRRAQDDGVVALVDVAAASLAAGDYDDVGKEEETPVLFYACW